MIDIGLLPPAALTMVMDRVEERLAAIQGIASLEIMPSGEPNRFPALEVYAGNKTVVDGETGFTRHELGVTIEGYVQGGSGSAALADLGKLYCAVVMALFGPSDGDELGDEVTEGNMRLTVAELASKKRLGFALDLGIQFATERDNPTISA